MTAAVMTLDSDNEFGYDFSVEEEELLLQLASDKNTLSEVRLKAVESISERTDLVQGHHVQIQDNRQVHLKGVGRTPSAHDTFASEYGLPVPSADTFSSNEVFYPDSSKTLNSSKTPSIDYGPTVTEKRAGSGDDETYEDGRSPLQRFRSYPRKPLTVSDLTSGAWCELQYWYTLTRLPGGRRTRTAAMKQGTKVHQKLEDEVHTTVKIDVMTKEDAFGLKLWNLVQGLRTLRDTGLTRELEVWGMVDENLVNGVIDGVSYENPNPEFEEELSSQESQQVSHRQSSLTDHFPPERTSLFKSTGPKVYLTDVKTRGSLAPVSKTLLRPAKIQLLLYHRLLSGMAAGRLDLLKVFRRYGLDPDNAFSDTFIAQIGSLHDEVFVDAPSISVDSQQESSPEDPSSSFQSSSSSDPDLLQYRTLRELMPLIERELELTFPDGENSLGHMLRVQYVHRSDGREIDLHDFPVSRQALRAYLDRYMAWWRGERKAKGVDIEEAFKCRTCEFVSDCSWRLGLEQERLSKAQQRIRTMKQTASEAA